MDRIKAPIADRSKEDQSKIDNEIISNQVKVLQEQLPIISTPVISPFDKQESPPWYDFLKRNKSEKE